MEISTSKFKRRGFALLDIKNHKIKAK